MAISAIDLENESIMSMVDQTMNLKNIDKENANTNQNVFSARNNRVSSEVTKKYAMEHLLSPAVRKAFEDNWIYIHDFNSYASGMTNCITLDLADVLKNGFYTNNADIREPSSISSAMQLTAVVIQCQSNLQFGGVAIGTIDYDLAPYVNKSFRKYMRDGLAYISGYSDKEINHLEKTHPKLFKFHKESLTTGSSSEEAYQYAWDKTVQETHQGAEALIHNLNSLQSRAADQLPFSSINYGADTTPAGRLVTKSILQATIEGVGAHHLTPIFPVQVFQYYKGINDRPGTPNYDLFQLAIKCTSLRLFPNYANCTASYLKKPTCKQEIFNTMGCIDGQEVVTYKWMGVVYVEGIERMYDRLSSSFSEEKQGLSKYIKLDSVQIYDSSSNGFVDCKLIIRNPDQGNWNIVKLDNGRNLIATSDHPLPTQEGRKFVKDLNIGDSIPVVYKQYTEELLHGDEEQAWLDGLLICDGCYQGGEVRISLGLDEKDILTEAKNALLNVYGLDSKVIEQFRGTKGNYYDLVSIGNNATVRHNLQSLFGGLNKKDRNIPSCVFCSSDEVKLRFLAGMIDADGHIKEVHKGARLEIGSTNRELALQQVCLLESVGIPAKVYLNHYNRNSEKLRYKVEAYVTKELSDLLTSAKKRNVFMDADCHVQYVNTPQIAKVIEIIPLGSRGKESFDVTTSSDRFDVSGINSHNCRTQLADDRFGLVGNQGRGNISPVTINLAKIGIEHGICLGKRQEADIEGFWDELDRVLDVTAEALVERFEYQGKQPAKSAPFMYKNQLMKGKKLNSNDSVREVLKHGTLAIGLLGLSNCMMALFGKHQFQDERVWDFAYSVYTHVNNFKNIVSEKYDLNFSVYSSPAESSCYTIYNRLVDEYGEIPGVIDRGYLTNSFHCPVSFPISAEEKIEKEAPFHELSRGGAISYVECDGLAKNNLPALEQLIDLAMDKDISYFALNFPVDTCRKCNYQGVIDNACPKCGGTDIQRLKRITGYLSGDYKETFNKGKQDEVRDRFVHIHGNILFDGVNKID